MKAAMPPTSVRALLLTLGVCAVVSAGGARCEVGAASGAPIQPAPKVDTYQYEIIGDDPVPFGVVWRVQSQPTPGRIVLNPNGELNGDGAPSALNDPNTGLALVAWARNSATGFDVVISRFANGAWTTPQVIAGTSANELDPQLVLAPDGSVRMFYWVDGTSPQVFYTEAPADLSSWSAPLLVSQPGQAACRPAGVYFDSVLRVVYEVHDYGYGNTPRQVVLARLDAGAFVPEIVAITNNLSAVRPQVHSHAGHMWVDWIDAETSGASGELAWTRLDAQGHWEPIRYEPFANYEQREYFVRGTARGKAIQ